MSPSETNRKVLEVLYKCHMAESFCPVKTSDILNVIGLDDEAALRDSIQYLHDQGLVEGIFAAYLPQGYFESARITNSGIELMNDAAELDRLFPVDSTSKAIEELAHKLRSALQGLDIPNDEKEDALQRLNEFITDPIISKALRRVFS